jgi:D-alanine-D-alanine ligase
MKNVAVICGGLSSEYEISLLSAKTIISHFPKEYACHKVILNDKGWWLYENEALYPIDLNDFSVLKNSGKLYFDFAFIYIHGFPGEDGKVQAYLDILNIPYVNSSALSSELSFDKWFCNQFLKPFGVPVAKSMLLLNHNNFSDEEIIAQLGLPCFVKPTDSGSSYGITKVNEKNALRKAIHFAFDEGGAVVVESFLKGTEVTCGVYRNLQGIVALPPTEIIPEGEYFDYDAKYLGKSKEITPARITSEETLKVQELSKKVYQVLRLRSIVRVDYIIVQGEPYLIEVNTTPGFSPASLIPQQLACAKINIEDFLRQIIQTELKQST